MIRAFRLPLLWLGLVLFLGAGQFGVKQTQAWIVPMLKFVAPWATPAELHGAHLVLRKLSHLTEYAVLALLWLRACLASRRLTLRTASWVALLVSVTCAVLDEAHQSMLPSRTGSVADVVLDSLGALMMLIVQRVRQEPGVARGGGVAASTAYEPGG
jgi:VanZ family protein